MSALERLRPLLNGWRRSGNGWRADCPLGHRSRGTLAISESDTGLVLLHDFGGHTPAEVLDAIGLTLADLYPERVQPRTPEDRRALRQSLREAGWRAALRTIEHEAYVLTIAGHHLASGLPLSADDLARLASAADRIADARSTLA
jgi:hypothetical protein